MNESKIHFEYRDGDFHSAQAMLRAESTKAGGISVVAQVKARINLAQRRTDWNKTYAEKATAIY